MRKVLLFAGTTEGRRLAETLLAVRDPEALEVVACVATEYGREVLEDRAQLAKEKNLTILSGRLTEEEMAELMGREGFDVVVDATHPYAAVVTDCIHRACAQTGTAYLRLLREKGAEDTGGNAVFVESAEEAAEFLNGTEGPVLLTTGSKELSAFTAVADYRQRLFARVLPMAEVVAKCADLGFAGRQLICMQGPFSYDMNAALLRQTKARYLVTKDSGKTGGFDEKLRAAEDLSVCPVIIGRRPEEDGRSWDQVILELSHRLKVSFSQETEGAQPSAEWKMESGSRAEKEDCGENKGACIGGKSHWFPLFTNIENKNILVIGGGRIAARRIQTLAQFSCRLTVVAREAAQPVRELAEAGQLTLRLKDFQQTDLLSAEGRPADFVLAATDDRQLNHRIWLWCKEQQVPVNVSDRKEECDFYFPAVALSHGIVAGFTAEGKDHPLVKEAAKRVRSALAELREERE